MSAEARREAVIAAAGQVFAAGGYEATSTGEVARRAGISQPYVFRLFGSKKDLFLAGVERCFERTVASFDQASRGLSGQEALMAMGFAYAGLIRDAEQLRLQMHAFTASAEDPDIRAATGMLCNVVAAVVLDTLAEPWARDLCPAGRSVAEH